MKAFRIICIVFLSIFLLPIACRLLGSTIFLVVDLTKGGSHAGYFLEDMAFSFVICAIFVLLICYLVRRIRRDSAVSKSPVS